MCKIILRKKFRFLVISWTNREETKPSQKKEINNNQTNNTHTNQRKFHLIFNTSKIHFFLSFKRTKLPSTPIPSVSLYSINLKKINCKALGNLSFNISKRMNTKSCSRLTKTVEMDTWTLQVDRIVFIFNRIVFYVLSNEHSLREWKSNNNKLSKTQNSDYKHNTR